MRIGTTAAVNKTFSLIALHVPRTWTLPLPHPKCSTLASLSPTIPLLLPSSHHHHEKKTKKNQAPSPLPSPSVTTQFLPPTSLLLLLLLLYYKIQQQNVLCRESNKDLHFHCDCTCNSWSCLGIWPPTPPPS